MNRIFFLLIAVLFFVGTKVNGQPQVVDRVMAVVGSKIILKSDIEKQYTQYLAQAGSSDENIKCNIFDQLIMQKLLLNQADLDSVTVSDGQVDDELEKRMSYFVSQLGSEEKLEEYFHTSTRQLKEELRSIIQDQMVVQTMQSKITKDITATPNDVRSYFENIPQDSIPYMDAEMEIAQIVRTPPASPEEKKRVKDQLEEYRTLVMNGADFSVYAALYSDDKSTAKRGGELGYFGRGAMVPEFEAAAFALKPGEVSSVIETKFGYHIIQMIDRRGEQVNARHILLQPKVQDEDLYKAYQMLDSLSSKINLGGISFADAALRFSEDIETKNNGGLIINPETNTTRLLPDKMDRLLFFQVDSMALNQVSRPLQMQTPEGQMAYRIVTVKSRTKPHRANLKDDYQKIQEVVLQEKQAKAVNDWVEKKRKNTYIQIMYDYDTCKEALQHWTMSESKIK